MYNDLSESHILSTVESGEENMIIYNTVDQYYLVAGNGFYGLAETKYIKPIE